MTLKVQVSTLVSCVLSQKIFKEEKLTKCEARIKQMVSLLNSS